jgi:hypothetical protein
MAKRLSTIARMKKVNPVLTDNLKRKALMLEIKALSAKYGLNVGFGTFIFDHNALEVRCKLSFKALDKNIAQKVKVGTQLSMRGKNFLVTKITGDIAFLEQRSKWGHNIPLANPKICTVTLSKLNEYNPTLV